MFSYLPYNLLNQLISFLNYTIGKGHYYAVSSIPNEVGCVSKIIKIHSFSSPCVIFDIGARSGKYTDHCLKIYPLARYYLFEPNKKNYLELLNKFNKFSNVKIYNLAISDEDNKEALLYSNFDGSGYASLLKRNLSHMKINMETCKEIVKTITLKKFILENNIDHVDILKIDVEGFEMKVLEGINALLKKINIIQFEISSGQIDSKNYFKDFWFFFIKFNFKMYLISPSRPIQILKYKERDEFFDKTNYIAANTFEK